ncbi:hypothetical protein DFR48_108122 [Ciceribacter lividus]|uniref:NADPH-dependent 2,4-dienoyl-CoA reductase/sulfur reductase-like enzyme n=1 Tax=Ciceribacter lividus TaxID=1197950 RepID=A0A6I7HJB0_9HYPH|nr:NAD(P)/FAD-dependent oxidoreductase [Ciceribacter lividus]RCW22600.1 hypothetical protein DFR48_108122 [Ciceribacter lividus]
MTDKPIDLIIVGAGPAGMSAAIEARRAGLSVCVIDEGIGVGGQIYRSVLKERPELASILGRDYLAGQELAREFLASGSDYLATGTVFMIERDDSDDFLVGVTLPDGALQLRGRYLLIATGALERPFPVRGWTLPGVMTAGAAQTMLKSSGTVPSGRICLAGSGPLLFLLAVQYIRAGVEITAVLDTTPWSNWLGAVPFLPAFMTSRYMWKGMKLLREVASHTPVIRGVSALEALGDGRLNGVRYVAGGKEKRLDVDTLLLHLGAVPQVNLAMSAGARHHWNDKRLAFEPILDEWGETSVERLFVAGDSAGIDGAEAAVWRGILAASQIVKTVHCAKAGICPDRQKQARAELRKTLRGRRFLDRLYRPPVNFRTSADDVIVCRCEEVSAGEVRSIAAGGAIGPNQVKAFSRAGMGPCQGRMCGLTICELIAEQTGSHPQAVGYMNIRAPVKPVRLGEIARMREEGGHAGGEPQD